MTTETVPDTGRPAEQSDASIDELAVTTIRTLAMDAVQAANSGHPGTPMAMAPVAYTLWQDFLRFDPDDPIWPGRDRFVLSIGHASTLLYALLHLAGVKAVNPAYERLGELSVPLEDIKRFRQIDSRCPGHPEYRWTSGVETTTGPLGQGVATSVGMAIAGRVAGGALQPPRLRAVRLRRLRAVRRRRHDGGHLVRGRLAGRPPRAREPLLDLRQQPDHDRGRHEPRVLRRRRHALHRLRLERHARRRRQRPRRCSPARSRRSSARAERPTLIIVDSHIAYGSPTKQGTSVGARRAARRGGGPPHQAGLRLAGGRAVPRPRRRARALRGQPRRARPQAARGVDGALRALPGRAPRPRRPAAAHAAARAARRLGRRDPRVPARREGSGRRARRRARCSTRSPKHHPWLLGGAADLAPSTKTKLTFEAPATFSREDRHGRNLHFGVREHAMGAAVNGLALSKLRPFGSGFLIFSDYGRAPLRLGALMEIPTIHIFTHDSIGVGEDGPTHQPIEQLASLRAMPALITIRPGRRQRGRRVVAADHGAQARPGRARALAAGDADARPLGLRAGRGRAPRRLRARRPAGRRPRGDHHGHRHRGRSWRSPPTSS